MSQSIQGVTSQGAAQRVAEAAASAIGDHTVQLGGQPPVRLDKIQGSKIPFQGFTRATRMQRADQGMADNATASLRALTRPGGVFSAKNLLNGLKSFQTQLSRAAGFSSLTPAEAESKGLEVLQNMAGNLSSTDLAAVYQSFQSPEMALLKMALEAEIRSNPLNMDARNSLSTLFDMEATVLKEVSERMISVMELDANPETDAALRQGRRDRAVEGPDSYREDLSPRNLATLVETSAQSSTRAEREHALRTAELADHSIHGPAGQALDARQIGDILRHSELTINLTDISLFDADDGSINDQRINVFHSPPEAVVKYKGSLYLGFRDAVERSLFPELGSAPALGNERPTYAAVNTSGIITGMATNYGDCVLVLRPETARRATYTMSDSFVTIPLEFNPARRDACMASLNHLPEPTTVGLEPAEATALLAKAEQLRSPTSPLRQAIQDALESIPDSTPDGSRMTLAQWERSVPGAQGQILFSDLVRPVLVQAFTDVAAQRARSATHDTLETLLPHMNEVQGASLMRAAMDGRKGFCMLNDYIEAQVQGSLLISRDVGEIRVSVRALLNRDNSLNENRTDRLCEFAASHNITLNITDGDAVGHLNPAAVTALTERGLTVHKYDDIERSRLEVGLRQIPADQQRVAAAFNQSHQSIQGTREAARALLEPENSAALEARLLSLLPAEAPGGVPLEGRALPLAGAALDRVKARFLENVNAALKAAVTAGQGVNTESVVAEALKAAAEKPLAQKTTLLQELERLEFDNPAQKAAFSHWVISARALSDPAEMRMIHANALALSARLERLWQPPSQGAPARNPTPTELAQAFNSAARDLSVSVSAYQVAIKDTGREFGGDDVGAEFSRLSFMAAEFFRAKAPRLATDLLQTLKSPQMSEFRGVCSRLHGELRERVGLTPEQREELPDVQNMAWVMKLTGESLAQQLGQPAGRDSGFTLALDYVPPSARAILSGTVPSLAAVLNTDFPRKTPVSIAAFHAPAQGAIQADWSGRRAFHLDMLNAYRAHEERFDGQTGVHGLAHASRVFIFGTVLGNIMRERGAKVDMTALTCAASGHDAGRQANGPDQWEKDSAAIALDALQSRFSPDAALGAGYMEDFQAQIIHPKSFGADERPTLEAWLMQSADAMDIGRVADFNMEQWIFLREPVQLPNGPALPPDQRLREALVREADALRMLSDPVIQSRVRYDELSVAMMSATLLDQAEALQAQRDALPSTADALTELRRLSNEDYMARLEGFIREHSEELPLLNRYYFQQ
ncbi:hypothetical protein AGMMS50256_01890 [Betaproteobacteria bacterium]|nr:hypothetical protein AGMMS50256_01890 [Betaproteobacteria bacterium]